VAARVETTRCVGLGEVGDHSIVRTGEPKSMVWVGEEGAEGEVASLRSQVETCPETEPVAKV